MKVCIVLRSVSGSGKSTFAEYVKGLNFNKDIRVCCADDFLMKDGKYDFNPRLLGVAHKECQAKFQKALEEGQDVIIANTNTTRSERDFYVSRAKEAGYMVFSLAVENLGTTDVHNVPKEVLDSQREKLKTSIQL